MGINKKEKITYKNKQIMLRRNLFTITENGGGLNPEVYPEYTTVQEQWWQDSFNRWLTEYGENSSVHPALRICCLRNDNTFNFVSVTQFDRNSGTPIGIELLDPDQIEFILNTWGSDFFGEYLLEMASKFPVSIICSLGYIGPSSLNGKLTRMAEAVSSTRVLYQNFNNANDFTVGLDSNNNIQTKYTSLINIKESVIPSDMAYMIDENLTLNRNYISEVFPNRTGIIVYDENSTVTPTLRDTFWEDDYKYMLNPNIIKYYNSCRTVDGDFDGVGNTIKLLNGTWSSSCTSANLCSQWAPPICNQLGNSFTQSGNWYLPSYGELSMIPPLVWELNLALYKIHQYWVNESPIFGPLNLFIYAYDTQYPQFDSEQSYPYSMLSSTPANSHWNSWAASAGLFSILPWGRTTPDAVDSKTGMMRAGFVRPFCIVPHI